MGHAGRAEWVGFMPGPMRQGPITAVEAGARLLCGEMRKGMARAVSLSSARNWLELACGTELCPGNPALAAPSDKHIQGLFAHRAASLVSLTADPFDGRAARRSSPPGGFPARKAMSLKRTEMAQAASAILRHKCLSAAESTQAPGGAIGEWRALTCDAALGRLLMHFGRCIRVPCVASFTQCFAMLTARGSAPCCHVMLLNNLAEIPPHDTLPVRRWRCHRGRSQN